MMTMTIKVAASGDMDNKILPLLFSTTITTKKTTASSSPAPALSFLFSLPAALFAGSHLPAFNASFALAAVGALVAVIVPLAAPTATKKLYCPSSSPRLASVEDMDDNDDNVDDLNNNGGGLWQR